ncbi:MAG: 2-dehydro-3-deoxygalactonokinase, partial [Sediminibacterium sp.]
IGILQHKINFDLEKIPLIISGMATSSIGMLNLPYEKLPFSVTATTGFVCKIQQNGTPILLITGLSSDDDLMRGEETQIVGLFHTAELSNLLPDNGVFVLPGTHSKHVTIRQKDIVSIKTFVTGEIFKLLRENGTLSTSLEYINEERNEISENQESFKKGIQDSKKSSLLNSLFQVRVNDILNKLNKEQNFYYLSGLLIGSEFSYLVNDSFMNDSNKLIICSSFSLINYYKLVLNELGLNEHSIFISPELLDKATINGQITAYKKYVQTL